MAACAHSPIRPSLDDRVFLSQRVTVGGAPRELVEGTQLALQFHADRRVSASAGCNTMSAGYRIDGGVLVIRDAAVTEIGCATERHAQDEWYFGFLGSRPAITIAGNELVLDGGGTRIEYLDQEEATPDLPLSGPAWTVDTIIAGDAAMHANWSTPAILRFREGGRLDAFTGCNSAWGNYRVEGETIAFDSIGVTRRGCLDEDLRRLEAAVLGVLTSEQPVTWEITVDRLSLRGEDVGLVAVGRREETPSQ